MSDKELFDLLQEIKKRWSNPQVQYDLAYGDLGDMQTKANNALRKFFLDRYTPEVTGSFIPVTKTEDDGA